MLALVIDSTNAFREGISPSEADVARSLAEIIKKAPRRVAVTTFSSNVARVKAVAEAAQAAGRKLVVAGRALHRVIDVAVDTGYLPAGFRYLDQDQFTYLDRSEIVLLCTGSQGEPRAALARIADEEHPEISLDKGDIVIFSSRTIPGNEKAVGRIQNGLARIGCDILTDNEALVHVSGHPRRDELRQMYRWMRPKIVVPMHGEARHLKAQAELAREMGVPYLFTLTDGEILRIAPDPAVIDDAPVGRLFRDGRLLVPDARRTGARAAQAVDRRRRHRQPRRIAQGRGAGRSAGHHRRRPGARTPRATTCSTSCSTPSTGRCARSPQKNRKNPESLAESVRRAVRAAVNEAWGKKPICKVLVNVVDTKG